MQNAFLTKGFSLPVFADSQLSSPLIQGGGLLIYASAALFEVPKD